VEWLGFDGEYDRTPLNEMYEAALRSGRPMPELQAFLEDRLLAKNIPDWYLIPTRVYWYHYFVTFS